MRRGVLLLLAAVLAFGAAARAAPPASGSRFVSMGSSYAAGPGVGRPEAGSGGCARSLDNYARQVAAHFGLSLDDVSCSGATTANILDRGQYGFAPEIEAVTPDTALVTILIGGNDVAYVGNLMGLSCRDGGGTGCRVLPADAVERAFDVLPGALRRVVAETRRRAPRARIVLVDYLPTLPEAGSPVCAAIVLRPKDVSRVRAVFERVNRLIDDTAASSGVPVIRASRLGIGHDACAATPFMVGFRPPTTPGWPQPVAYHPTKAGMDAVAAALAALLAAPNGASR